jgi:hypothetical protein
MSCLTDVQGGEISVKTDSYAYGVVLCELLTGLNPMAKPLPMMVVDALEEDSLGKILDKKTHWTLAIARKLADIAVRCSAYRKIKRATVQEVLPELELLNNPDYMPTRLASGDAYYDPDTGLLTQHS